MNCYMFPGQPLAAPASLPSDTDFEEISSLTREKAGFDLISFSWTASEATENVKLQVYGVAMGLYATRRLRHQGIVPQRVAEHSQGIYAALAAAGSVSEGDAVEMAWRAGVSMAKMSAGHDYALGCVIGLTLEPLLSIAENNGVYLANHNTSRHFLLSGERRNMEEAEAEVLAGGAFSVKLFACDAPLHTPLMVELHDELTGIFSEYTFRQPQIPLMDHIDQDYVVATDLPAFLVREIEAPVFWEKTYVALRRSGITGFHEVGAGDSLKKYNRWIENELGR